MDSDQALTLLGSYSKWQLRTYFMYAFGFGIPLAWMWMAIVYIGDTPNYRCKLGINATLNESIPQNCDAYGQCEYDQCQMYTNVSQGNATGPCQHGYWYDPDSGYESTLASEFDLVCGKDWLVELSMTIQSIGAVVGAIVFPILSDTYGRKFVFLGCLWTNIAVAIVQALSVDMTMYSILGFFDGLQQQGMTSSAFILAMELFPTDQRTFAGVVLQIFFGIGYITLVPIAYFIRNWRYLQLAITVPLVTTIGFYWFVAESIPWLVANGKTEKAEKILQDAAKFNGVTLPKNIFSKDEFLLDTTNTEKKENNNKLIEEEQDDKKATSKVSGFLNKLQSTTTKSENTSTGATITRYKVWDLLRSKKMVLYSVIQWFVWFINSIGYNTIALTVTYLPGNRYLNSFLYAAMEIPAYLLMWIMLYYFGRRITIALAHFLGGIALIAMIIQLYDTDNKLTGLIITLSVLGKIGFTFSYGAIYVQCPELYPTTVRNTGMGLCQMFAKVGSFVAPYFRILARQTPILPPIIVGGCSIFAGFLILILPETRHEPLPDTIEQIENFKRSRRPNT